MPARVIDEPLAVECTFPDGDTYRAGLADLANRRLAADLALGMSRCIHPEGGVTKRRTATNYATAVRHAVRELGEAGFRGDASALRTRHLSRLWLSFTPVHEQALRMILRGFRNAGGVLDAGVVNMLAGRNVNVVVRGAPYAAYTDGEWKRITERAEQIVTDARQRQAAMLRAAATGGDPTRLPAGHTWGSAPGIKVEDMAWLLLDRGPLHRSALRQMGAGSLGFEARLLRSTDTLRDAREAFFPTLDVALAYQVLLAVHSGIVADGISSLGVADIDWTGDSTVLLGYVKGRTRPEALNLPKRAVRVLEGWLEYSGVLRGFAPPERCRDLWLWLRVRHLDVLSATVEPLASPSNNLTAWAGRTGGLEADDGSRLRVHRGRFRPTYQGLLARRVWTGRVTVDPNHTPRVEGDHYLAATTPDRIAALEAVIEDGQADLLRKARRPVVLADEQTAELVTGLREAVAEVGLDDAAIAELIGGRRDVFTAACSNQLASPYGVAGQPCPARPWVCLLCPLAVFLPRHAANLLRLKAFFARQSRQMTTEQFIRVFGPYADRLETEILPRFDERTLRQAAALVADDDTELPLRPEEATL
ncbi:hypothetical protein ACGFJT_41995 [Actinomadura geliboluensis]|uniref:hypothetical protein n=1 Tax=Actinomadura geliboluensis TaxID=882440 RepID=UPI00370FD341